jgi:hypothetical protein
MNQPHATFRGFKAPKSGSNQRERFWPLLAPTLTCWCQQWPRNDPYCCKYLAKRLCMVGSYYDSTIRNVSALRATSKPLKKYRHIFVVLAASTLHAGTDDTQNGAIRYECCAENVCAVGSYYNSTASKFSLLRKLRIELIRFRHGQKGWAGV